MSMQQNKNTKLSIQLLLSKFNKQEDDIAREDTNILTLTRHTDIVILNINVLYI
jgi:hypothetical protein